MEPDMIRSFLDYYQENYDFYQQAAAHCAQLCEMALENNGIRAIVTSRAKRPDRLAEKLYKRRFTYQQENSGAERYRTFEDINADIVDLIGIRISLYFPGDRAEVHKILHGCFSVRQLKTFPLPPKAATKPSDYQKRFSGYFATHYRVPLGKDCGDYQGINAEIQVASVLMHAWAEVEHDLSYKTYTGQLSQEEQAILDELNGLVLAGEISLERLQQAIRRRVDVAPRPFANHYELAVFLLNQVREKPVCDSCVGNVALLFQFLKAAKLNHPQDLLFFIRRMETLEEQKTLCDQLLDAILNDYPEHHAVLQTLRLESANPYQAPAQFHRQRLDESIQKTLGFFLFRWMLFETASRNLLQQRNISRTSVGNAIRMLREWELIDADMSERLERLRRLRHSLLYTATPPLAEEIIDGAEFLENLIATRLLPHIPATLWEATLEQMAPLTPE